MQAARALYPCSTRKLVIMYVSRRTKTASCSALSGCDWVATSADAAGSAGAASSHSKHGARAVARVLASVELMAAFPATVERCLAG